MACHDGLTMKVLPLSESNKQSDIAIMVLSGIFCLIGLLGNVLLVSYSINGIKTIYKILIFNLAFTALVTVIGAFPFVIIQKISVFENICSMEYKQISSHVNLTTRCVMFGTFILICLHRLFLTYRRKPILPTDEPPKYKYGTAVFVIIIWIASILLVVTKRFLVITLEQCQFLFAILYYSCFVIIFFSYSAMCAMRFIKRGRVRNSAEELGDAEMAQIKSKDLRRNITMLLVMMAMSVPFFARLFIKVYYKKELMKFPDANYKASEFLEFLLAASSAVNPIICYLGDEEIKQWIYGALKKFGFCCNKNRTSLSNVNVILSE